jgi:sulfur carrier protein
MKVRLCHPDRDVDVKGPKRVKELLRDLSLVQEAHLVIRGDDLVTEDEMLKDEDVVEIRPVISGGAFGTACAWRAARGSKPQAKPLPPHYPMPRASRLHDV